MGNPSGCKKKRRSNGRKLRDRPRHRKSKLNIHRMAVLPNGRPHPLEVHVR